MQGRQRTARPEAEKLEPGTYELVLDSMSVSVGMPKPEHCKKDASGRMKTPEESAYVQAKITWIEEESGIKVPDNFLKLPEFLEFSEDARYKSKFQKRLENLLNKQLDDNAGEKLTLNFDFIESWEELKEAVMERDQDRPIQIAVREFLWAGQPLFGHRWLVTVALSEKGYNEVTSVAPLPKRRTAPSAPAAQPAPQRSAPPARPARQAPAPVDNDEPFGPEDAPY